jgi:Protein involved in biosynthesis of mitomycin antibiotics/polyketide fumonisin|nr:phytanoyl-CoA dioxygenase family protein [uncultured Steroidobacter sp.]
MQLPNSPSWSESYRANGYFGPRAVFSAQELLQLNIVPIVRSLDRSDNGWARNRHMDHAEIQRLVFDARLVALVKALIPGDLMLWRTNIFEVPSNGAGFVWHRDTYPGLVSDELPDERACSIQVNLSSSSSQNAVAVIPGSHRRTDLELVDQGYVHCPSLGKKGHGSTWGVPRAARQVAIPLLPGECFVFHPCLLHASAKGRGFSAQIAQAFLRGDRSWFTSTSLEDISDAAESAEWRYSITLRLASPAAIISTAAFEECRGRGRVLAWEAIES